TEAQWQALCRATGNAGWLADPRFAPVAARQANRAALEAALAAWTGEHEVAEIEQCLQAAGVPVHRVSSSADLLADPQLAQRRHLQDAEHPLLGPVPLEGARAIFSRTPARPPTTGPTYGQHTQQVLRDLLGLADEEIVELTVAGVLE
ncbi:MAG TPA: CoA transferase, partial [Dehalococcoidia bacterium]|nr:CoA transferase [Dehalococcoidia bacterium]